MTEQRPIGRAEGRYRELEAIRSPYLERARECSKYTIPSLIPPDGDKSSIRLYSPFQSMGSRGVNNLGSKLLLTLLPPNSPFFRFVIDSLVEEEQMKDGGEDIKEQVEKALSKVERAIMTSVEASGDRIVCFEAMKHLIVGGNILLHDGDDGMRAFHLDRYVVKRDPMGNPVEIIVHEEMAPESLPEEFIEKLKESGIAVAGPGAEKVVSIYTHLERGDTLWSVYQESFGMKIEGTEGSYPVDTCPWLPLRFIRVDGEDYGRGYVEEYLGDLISLEGLSKAIVEGSLAAAKLIILVNPNGTTRLKTLANLPNGGIAEGNADDVTTVQMQKFHDFGTAERMIQRIEERLAHAFLMNTAVQRDAERVTAEEIRYMAGEIEDALGGHYSMFAQEFQLPYVNIKMSKLQRAGKLPKLPKELVKPAIVTGLDALARGHDRNKLAGFLQVIGTSLGPEAVMQNVNVRVAIERFAMSDGIDTHGLIYTEEEIAQKQQQNQMMALAQQLGPDAMKVLQQGGQQAPQEGA